jgi:hypothetical protein
LHGLGDKDVAYAMFLAQRSRKTRSDPNLIRLIRQSFCNSPRIFHAHSGDGEVDLSTADLRLIRGNLADFDFTEVPQAAPGRKFSFDRECDEDFHYKFRCQFRAGRYISSRSAAAQQLAARYKDAAACAMRFPRRPET